MLKQPVVSLSTHAIRQREVKKRLYALFSRDVSILDYSDRVRMCIHHCVRFWCFNACRQVLLVSCWPGCSWPLEMNENKAREKQQHTHKGKTRQSTMSAQSKGAYGENNVTCPEQTKNESLCFAKASIPILHTWM